MKKKCKIKTVQKQSTGGINKYKIMYWRARNKINKCFTLLGRYVQYLKHRAAWNKWQYRDKFHFSILEKNMNDTLALIGHALNSLKCDAINFVDVGCASGGFKKRLIENAQIKKPLFSVGIDPINYFKASGWFIPPYAIYIQAAVTNSDERTIKFHINRSCLVLSSAVLIMPGVLSSDMGRMYYVPPGVIRYTEAMGMEIETVDMMTLKLSAAIEQSTLSGEILHLVKIDAQGRDFDVIKSMGRYLGNNCLFIHYETIIGDEQTPALHAGQTRFSQERKFLENAGFRLFNIGKFITTPEANVVFVNTVLLDRLQ